MSLQSSRYCPYRTVINNPLTGRFLIVSLLNSYPQMHIPVTRVDTIASG